VAVNADNTATVSVHGFSACMTEFSLSLGAEMVFEQKAGCTKQVRLTDRKTTGSITIELPAFATKDFVAIASAQTEGTISWVHGGTAGNIITFTAAQAAFDSPTFVETDSVTHITLPFRLMPTSSGNDDFTLAFT
ncbi:MAG: phage tail tube protein, partial [Pseudohongiellaceae bacterium]